MRNKKPGALIPMAAKTGLPDKKTGSLEQIVNHETTKAWLQRLAKDLKKEMPVLKTKLNGRIVPVNHFQRLKKAFTKGGEQEVINYCKNVVANYNRMVEQHNKQHNQ